MSRVGFQPFGPARVRLLALAALAAGVALAPRPATAGERLAAQALAAARSELGGRRLRAVAAFAPGALEVTVTDDPMAVAARLRVTPAGAAGPVEGRIDVALIPGRRSVRVPLTLDRGGRVRVELLDARGHILRAWNETAPPPAAIARSGPAPTADAEAAQEVSQDASSNPSRDASPDGPANRTRRWYRNWRLWGGAGAGCALIGAGLVLVARESAADLNEYKRTSPQREFAESLSAQRRFDRSQAGAVAAFSMAGVSLGAATWLWLREREEKRTSRGLSRRNTAALAPLLGGGRFGIAVKIGF
ncbi:MAG TPA: hypothetical protein VKB80_10020 [Kofleriaceae bacterium]|nr:hypothetical protein [Kofleriaceae bacterium]